MYKTLLWGTGYDFSNYYTDVKYLEKMKQIEIIGVTGNVFYDNVYGYPFVKKEDIKALEIELIIVMTTSYYKDVISEINNLALNCEVISCQVVGIPDFDLGFYIHLKRNIPTVFSINCWGGLFYHRFRLPFMSPTVNMFMSEKDYMKFLKSPSKYVDVKLCDGGMDNDPYDNHAYPVALCEDIRLRFNHSENFKNAVFDWERRKARIDWDNLIVMIYTKSRETMNDFLDLEYARKICFSTEKSESNEVHTIPWNDNRQIPLWELVNNTVVGKYQYYNIMNILQNLRI